MKKVCLSRPDPVILGSIPVYSYLHTSCWRLSAHCKTFLDYKWRLIQEESWPTAGCLIIHLRRREFPSQRQWCLASQRRRNPKVSNLKGSQWTLTRKISRLCLVNRQEIYLSHRWSFHWLWWRRYHYQRKLHRSWGDWWSAWWSFFPRSDPEELLLFDLPSCEHHRKLSCHLGTWNVP